MKYAFCTDLAQACLPTHAGQLALSSYGNINRAGAAIPGDYHAAATTGRDLVCFEFDQIIGAAPWRCVGPQEEKAMLEIWGRKNSSNVIPVMWAVGELGLEHQRHNIGGSFGGDDTEAYARLNPNRLIPTISDDGFVLWESMAITRYLCRRYGLGTLFPDDDQQAALADQWMDWYKSSITPSLMPVFVNLVRTPKAGRNEDVIKRCTSATIGYLKLLDRHLQGKSYILGEHFSMGDIPLGAILYKYYNLDIERPALPNLEAWYARLCERPAYQRHAMIAFGSSPEEWLELEKAGA